ncbi:MAG: ABC transporter ATP-binding protein/permease, partial [Clostridia bacterium]|nr:ABC transporter ATP-binding protein/permease [Clostridia bacterium]
MIKRLSRCVREYLPFVLLTPLCVIVESILEILIPFYMADLIDYGVEMNNMEFIRNQGFLLMGLALISVVLGVAGGRFSAKASAGFAKNLRHDMYYNIQRFSFSNIDKFSTAGLVTRMTTDVTQIQQSFMMLTRMSFRAPCIMISAFVMAFKINGKLPFVFVAAVPIIVCGIIILIKVGIPLFQKMFKIYDKLNAVVQENVRGIRVVKAYVREEKETEKFHDVSGLLYATSVRAEKLMAFAAPVMSFAMYAVVLLICWFGAKFVVSREMTTGQLMSMFSYVSRVLTAFMMMSFLIIQVTLSGAAAKRIVEVLDEEPDITNKEDAVKEVKDGSIRFENVNFAYADGKDCLSNINLDIKSGQMVGIIGGTGCGKTSVVQLIPRLYDTREGNVYVGGINVKDYDLDTLRSNVAFVLQKNVLFSGTLRENLKWGKNDATDEEIFKALELAQAKDFVLKMEGGLDAMIEQGGTNVSGGQRQRLCIARALLMQPKILILDDSTSAVDTATEARIRQGFKDFIPETTKLIIAQRISSVKGADV